MAEFKVGDVVKLKSGGPAMTVQEDFDSTKKLVKCKWFVTPPFELKEGTFAEATLEKIQPK